MNIHSFRLSGLPCKGRICAALLLGLAAPLTLAQSGNFGGATPSVSDIVSGLKGEGGAGLEGVRTRALRPGAAAQATAAPSAPAAPAPASVAAPARAPSVSMQIQFEFGSDHISQASQATMENLARALSSDQLQGRQFIVVGHTDGVGSAEYNRQLSQRRAASVKAYLVRNGVDATRLRTQGKGYAELLDPANPRAAENRRVEIIAAG